MEADIAQLWIGAIAVMAAISSLVALALQERLERRHWSYLINRGFLGTAKRRAQDPAADADPNAMSSLASRLGDLSWRPSAMSNAQELLSKTGQTSWLAPIRHLALMWALGLAGLVLGAKLAAAQSNELRVIAALVVGAVLSRIPNVWLKRKATARSAQITRELPDVLDQVTISVGAGLGLDAALTRVASRTAGVLGQELTRTMQDIRLGVDRPTAFTNLAKRCDSEDVEQLVGAILQGLETGMPLTPILAARAHELRRKRRAAAEERAHKLSVKLAFPTAACILPALLLMVIGPAVLKMITSPI